MNLAKIKNAPAQIGKATRFLPKPVTRGVALQSLMMKKHSPEVLFGVGVAGMVGTVVLACRATLRIDEVLDEVNNKAALADHMRASAAYPEYSEKDYRHDIYVLRVKGIWALTRLYAPAVGLGTLSVAALTGSHHILSTRNTAMAAAYAAVDRGFQEYRDRVVEEFGEDKDRELRHGTETYKEMVLKKDGGTKTKTAKRVNLTNKPSMYAKIFGESNENWDPVLEYNLLFIRSQQNYANQQLTAKGFLILNDVYKTLGFEPTPEGCVVGWLSKEKGGKDGYVDFGVFSDDNLEHIHDFVTGRDMAIMLDFNVDGLVYEKVGRSR